MSNKTKKTPVPKKLKQPAKKLCFKHEPWYQSAHKAMSIAERKSELGTLYRVRVGPFSEIEAMNRARLRLSDNGVDAAVVKVPK